MPVSQAVEGGGPASELLAAFRAQRVAALQGRGLAADGADTGHVSVPGQQSLAEGTSFSATPIRNGTGTASGGVPDTAGWDGDGAGRAPPAPVTADQLRAIMPYAGATAGRYVDALNRAMTAHGINTPEQRAAFLAQVSVESNQLRNTTENLNYTTAQRLQEVYGTRPFPTPASAAPYLNNPEGLANHVYATRNGNGDEASGDGWRFRGRGLMQVTGRGEYRAVGHENDPEALETSGGAADAAAAYWANHGLNGRTTGALDRQQFDRVSRTVNAHDPNLQARWDVYQRALRALNAGL